ncbi:UDP-glucose 4-epimerase GalE [Croceicoccus hydrothermalis]|uniref:UDP-glucose 4-epimerase GalE n=1 Tax=Croceicoccus hydrothermalis TaxID=2867964 RepID=UPI001EFBD705|nr:UDP-glucose 4-epimerase GalE [Croceicoccus hydrothermalis]
MRTVLVIGGAGYVGSHCCKAFAAAGWRVVCFDNLSRGWRDAVKWGPLIEGDLLNRSEISAAVRDTRPDLIAHFAAFAYVGESVASPEIYYRNNCVGTINMLDAMLEYEVKPLLFSSTCASYGIPQHLPIDENHPQVPINPYGESKLMAEKMLRDYGAAHGLRTVALRYFNAAGADADGEIGERHEPETHAIPLTIEAAIDPDATFTVMGTDFDTRDGSAVRDYIHVTDLASAHVAAGAFALANEGSHIFNLGTGVGTTVLELLAAVERIAGRRPSVEMGGRRAGDPAALVASYEKAQRVLGWQPQCSDIDTIVDTALAWRRSRAGA